MVIFFGFSGHFLLNFDQPWPIITSLCNKQAINGKLTSESNSTKNIAYLNYNRFSRETDAFVKNLDASKKQSAILERKKRKGVHMDLKDQVKISCETFLKSNKRHERV